LCKNSEWWDVLQDYGVGFEAREFEDEGKVGEYATSLVLPLITNAATRLALGDALSLAQKFCASFEIPDGVAPQKCVEYILKQSTPAQLVINTNVLNAALVLLPSTAARLSTLRRCVIDLESSSKNGTAYHLHTAALEYYRRELGELLRECCEDDEPTLNRIREDDPREKKKQSVREEIERVDRRREALAILTTFAAKQSADTKLPNYNKLFLKFPTPFGSTGRGVVRRAGVLLNLRREAGLFDPLDSLREFLGESTMEDLSSTVLIPLCHSLGLPGGFIPARMMQETFLRLGSTPPSFDASVKPVLAKLPAFDAGVLGEWCALKYFEAGRRGKFAKMRLQCLEESYRHSLEASKLLEDEESLPAGVVGGGGGEDSTISFGNSDGERSKQARQALEMVRRIGKDLSALKNELKMREILEGGGSGNADSDSARPVVDHALRFIVDDILRASAAGRGGDGEDDEEDATMRGGGGENVSNVEVESLVEKLLSEGAERAAKAYEKGSFKIEDLRDAAWRVHSAAGALAEVHTEVNIERTCRRLARALLEAGKRDAEGREKTETEKEKLFAPSSSGGGIPMSMNSIGEDDEEEEEEEEEEDGEEGEDEFEGVGAKNEDSFSLDLKSLALTKAHKSRKDEEQEEKKVDSSILKRTPFSKDDLAAVQIAFLLSYSFSFFGGSGGDDANCSLNASLGRNGSNSSFGGGVNGSRDGIVGAGVPGAISDPVSKHSRDLIGAVFSAQSKTASTAVAAARTVLGERSENVEEVGGEEADDDEAQSDGNIADGLENNTHGNGSGKRRAPFVGNSFAAKYRALRAAMLLAPREAIVAILPEFAAGCDLDKLIFASFCAKEMEAMHLPLPCASLVELGGMDLSNLAGALWKDHALDVGKGEKKEAFHSLLIRMSIENGVGDLGLLKTVVESVVKQAAEFPKVLVMCCELLVSGKGGKFEKALLSHLKGLVKEVGRLIGDEMARMKPQPQGYVSESFVSTAELKEAVDGFVRLVVRLGVIGGGKSDWSVVGLAFLGLLEKLVECYFDGGDKEDTRRVVLEAVAMLGCETKGGAGRVMVWKEIAKIAGGANVLKELVGRDEKALTAEGTFSEMVREEIGMLREISEVLAAGGAIV
jgi:hypothetical protein